VPVPQYVQPQFRYRSPKQRFRCRIWLVLACLGVAGIGAAMMVPLGPRKSDAAMAPGVQAPGTEIVTSIAVAYAVVDPQPAGDAQVIAQKPFCVGPSQRDGECILFQLPKVRMVRVPRASTLSQHGNSGKPGVAPALAATAATKVDKWIAEPKRVQRSAHHHREHRRQPLARGYASRERGYYGHQGLAGNFW
jgi:hypothetical protein